MEPKSADFGYAAPEATDEARRNMTESIYEALRESAAAAVQEQLKAQ